MVRWHTDRSQIDISLFERRIALNPPNGGWSAIWQQCRYEMTMQWARYGDLTQLTDGLLSRHTSHTNWHRQPSLGFLNTNKWHSRAKGVMQSPSLGDDSLLCFLWWVFDSLLIEIYAKLVGDYHLNPPDSVSKTMSQCAVNLSFVSKGRKSFRSLSFDCFDFWTILRSLVDACLILMETAST